MDEYEVVPYQFWQTRRDRLAEVLVRKSLDAHLCAELWRFYERTDEPPKIMDVLVITRWPEHPDDPEMFVASPSSRPS
jgi:hypothetical protein